MLGPGPGRQGLRGATKWILWPFNSRIDTLVMTPKIFAYHFLPSKTSGGRYHSVTTSLEYVFVGNDFALANPKSANFNSPFELINRF